MEKNNEITEDGLSSAEKEVQKLIDEYATKIDEVITKKSDEIMEV
jgi:ribosome recycling factor